MVDSLIKRFRGSSGDAANSDRLTTPTFSAGDWVAVAGLGARQLLEVTDDGAAACLDDPNDPNSLITMPPAEARRRVRPLTSFENAGRVNLMFGREAPSLPSPDDYERSVTYRVVLRSNDLMRMAAALNAIYRHPKAGYPEELHVEQLENAIFSELSRVLGRPQGSLRRSARLAAGAPPGPPDRSEEVAACEPLPVLPGHKALGAFAVETHLVLGEAGHGVELLARPGIWFAYLEQAVDAAANDANPSQLLVVHANALHQLAALRAQATALTDALTIAGATMAVVDAEMARDPIFRKHLGYAGTAVVDQRGVQVHLSGEGRVVAHLAEAGGQVIYVGLALK